MGQRGYPQNASVLVSLVISDRVPIFRVWRPWTMAKHTMTLWPTWRPQLMWWSTMPAGVTRSQGRPFPLVSVILRYTQPGILPISDRHPSFPSVNTHWNENVVTLTKFSSLMKRKLTDDAQLRPCNFDRCRSNPVACSYYNSSWSILPPII